MNKKEILNIVKYETLIGKQIEVIDSPNKNYKNLAGIILLETENTIVILDEKTNIEKTLLKKGLIIRLNLEEFNLKVIVEVDKILNKTLIYRIKRFQ